MMAFRKKSYMSQNKQHESSDGILSSGKDCITSTKCTLSSGSSMQQSSSAESVASPLQAIRSAVLRTNSAASSTAVLRTNSAASFGTKLSAPRTSPSSSMCNILGKFVIFPISIPHKSKRLAIKWCSALTKK